MIFADIENKISSLVGSVGSTFIDSILYSMFPNEFELYLVALELTDYNDNIIEYFTFPINPSMLTKTEPRVKNIRKTFGGVTVNKSVGFVPQDLTIKGNFGRWWKILVRDKEVNVNSLLKKTTQFNQNGEFNAIIKNGYGSLKVLQHILQQSEDIVDGFPRKLYFHNFILGESYLVEVLDHTIDLNVQTNRIHNYSIKFKIISPVDLDSQGGGLNTVISGAVQKTLNNSVQTINSILNNII